MSSPASLKDQLCDRLTEVIGRINVAAVRAKRSVSEITLIAISKTHSADRIRIAIDCGAIDIGENRLQEAEPKILEIGRDRVHWHLVGHLQANKARKAVRLFDVIHSVDSIDLAKRLDRLCIEEQREVLPILVQINLGGEKTKSGIDKRDIYALVEAIEQCQRLRLMGLMSVPPYFEDPNDVRPFFSRLRELRDQLKERGAFADRIGELSMGMTHDFEVAIEEGATMVRIGTAIFGERW
ncbi:MAG TPA: YggS family pyridoxal phosphate-dependent enzyme [Pyrinomonadaceae bacterium]